MTESGDVRIPCPEPICLRDHPLENIRHFRRQWKYYCVYSGINLLSEEKKVAAFFLFVGREALTFIHENLELSDDEMSSCDRILDALEASHQPPASAVYQRFLFNQTVQNGDTVDQFLEKLRALADGCGFEDRLDEMLRDRFVVGLKSEYLQAELLSKPNLSLANAVRICKLREAEEQRLTDQGVGNVLEMASRVRSAAPSVDARSVESSVKVESVDEDDDLIVLSHYQGQPSNGAAKRIKLEPSNSADEGSLVVDVESNRSKESNQSKESKESNSASMKVGSFVVLKADLAVMQDPPIWRIDTGSLLRKFTPIEHKGIVLHKSTGVYSGWSGGARNNYYKAPVELRQSNKKEMYVFFRKDLVAIENQFADAE